MTDASIRPVTIAEHANLAAKRAVETGELQANPHPIDTAEWLQWSAAYERYLLAHSAPECERSA